MNAWCSTMSYPMSANDIRIYGHRARYNRIRYRVRCRELHDLHFYYIVHDIVHDIASRSNLYRYIRNTGPISCFTIQCIPRYNTRYRSHLHGTTISQSISVYTELVVKNYDILVSQQSRGLLRSRHSCLLSDGADGEVPSGLVRSVTYSMRSCLRSECHSGSDMSLRIRKSE